MLVIYFKYFLWLSNSTGRSSG